MSVESLLTKAITINRCGRLTLINLPELSSYSKDELNRACEFSNALERYLGLLERSPNDEPSKLRLFRHKFWCEAVLATHFENFSTEQICSAWSAAADSIISRAWELAGGDKQDFIILALGKLGSQELNLSSDVDLVLIRRDQKIVDLKVLRIFTALLSEINEFGFCLRLDLNLRPGGGSGSLITSQTEFEYHYGYHGEMWERLAYVRARHIYGDVALAAEILKFANHFSYRKHIDLTLVDDLTQLRNKIHFEMSLKDQKTFNLKLSPGGIRDIELFVHSLQLIHGGKNPSLQTFSTTKAIDILGQLSFIRLEDCQFLRSSYWFFRKVENHLQGQGDQQTYLIHRSSELCYSVKISEILLLAEKVNLYVSELLKIDSRNRLPSTLPEQQSWLEKKGFSQVSIEQTWLDIIATNAQSLNTDRAETARLEFLENFIEFLSSIDRNKDLALALLADFIRATRAKASLYSLLVREKKLTEELAWLFSYSPYLANILILRPELIDSLFFNAQAQLPEASDEFLEALIERRLLVEVLSAQKFLKNRDLTSLSQELSFTADEICKSLLERLSKELHCSGVNIICLGKWGGQELGFRSDLDFVFLSDDEPTPLQQKLCRKFMSWLNQPNRGGVLYNIDTRLRPSGQAGPLLVSQKQLQVFLETTTEPWQRQAYLRSRTLFPTPFSILKMTTQKPLSPEDLIFLQGIREKLLSQSLEYFDIKFQVGGLVDVEFGVQIALLWREQFSLDSSTQGMIQYLMDREAVSMSNGQQLIKNYNF